MRGVVIAWLVLACGCRQLFGIHDVSHATDATATDASDATDAPDAPPGVTCYGAPWQVCFDPAPTQAVVLDAPIDTGSSPLCVAHTGSPELGTACVIAGTTISTTANLHVSGPKPLVLVAIDDLVIANTIDVSSHTLTALDGAAADPATCPVGTAATTGSTSAAAPAVASRGSAVAAAMARSVATARRARSRPWQPRCAAAVAAATVPEARVMASADTAVVRSR